MSYLNTKNKTLYLHIARCAGMSMEGIPWVGGSGHDTLAQWEKRANLDGYFIWTFVRNPYARLVSAFFYVQSRGAKFPVVQINKGVQFADFVKRRLRSLIPPWRGGEIEWSRYLSHFAPQYYHTYSRTRELNFVGRVESIVADWFNLLYAMSCHTGIEKKAGIKKINHAPYDKDPMEYYDKEAKEIAFDVYAEDFKRFGYSPD